MGLFTGQENRLPGLHPVTGKRGVTQGANAGATFVITNTAEADTI